MTRGVSTTSGTHGRIEEERKPLNGAELLIQTVRKHGIKVCFANPGTTEMFLVGALDTAPVGGGRVRAVLGLHETVCVRILL